MKFFSSWSITTQLTVALIGAVVFTLLITGGVLSGISLQTQLNQLKLTEQAQAEIVAEKINGYVDDLQRKLSYLARVRGLTNFDRVTQYNLLEGLIYHNQAYEWVGLTDSQGHLQQAISPNGQLVPPEWATSMAFRRAFQEQEDFIGSVELDSISHWPMLILAVPIRDPQNEVAGMLVARINLKFLGAVLAETHVGRTGYVYVVDQRHFIIAQSGDLPETFHFLDLSQTPLHQVFTASSTTATQLYRGLREVEVLGNIAHVTSTDWQVAVELPVREAYQPLVDLFFIMTIGLIAGIILSAIFGLQVAQQVTQPLQDLTLAATALSQGKLDTQVILTQDNELKILADAFNNMAAQLRDNIKNLKQDIIDRREIEEILRMSEKKSRIVLETLPVGVSVMDNKGKVVDFNEMLAKILHLSPKDMFKNNYTNRHYLRPDGSPMPPEEFAPLRALAEQQPVFNVEMGFVAENQEVWLSVNAAPLPIADLGGVVVTSDITAYKQTEAEIKKLNAELAELLNTRTAQLQQEIVGHRQSEYTLQLAENRFRVAQDISLEAFTILQCVRDEQQRIIDFEWLYANPAAGRILGHAPDQLVGQRLLKVLPGNRTNTMLFERYVRIVEDGQGDEIELEYHDKGIAGWFRNMAVKLDDGLAISFSDITTRKQTETILQHYKAELEHLVEVRTAELLATNTHLMQEIADHQQTMNTLQEREASLRESQRVAHLGHWTWDTVKNQIIWSDEIKRIFGLDTVQFSGDLSEVIAQVVHPADKERILQINRAILNGQKTTPVECRIICPDQSIRVIWVVPGNKEVDEQGQILKLTGIVQDITERKQSEEKLNKLSQAVEQSNSSIVITDLMGNIEFVNHAFCQVTGYTFAEVSGKNPRILKSGYQSREFYTELWSNLVNCGAWRGELMNKKKNGELYWEMAHISAVRNSAGQVTHYVAVKDDITERKKLDMQIQVANQQLMQAYDETLEGWARALDLRDKETEGHSRRVTEMTLKLAQRCGIMENQLVHIRRGALLHDIGKMGIPDYILLKPGPLNDTERQIMQLHPTYAYNMLQPISYLQPALDIPYSHHERWDGTGYPLGLKGPEIPFAARLFAIVDVWDALRSNRPYRMAWSQEKTTEYILAQTGTHFDPQLVPLFLEICSLGN